MVVVVLYKDQLERLESLGVFGIFLINLLGSAVPIVPLPGIVSVFAGGTLYSPGSVAIAATLGGVFGDMLGFLFGVSGRKVFLRQHHVFYDKLVGFMKKYGAVTIFLFACIPNPIFDTIGIVAGILKYPVSKFFMWLFVGRLVRNLFLAYFGAQL